MSHLERTPHHRFGPILITLCVVVAVFITAAPAEDESPPDLKQLRAEFEKARDAGELAKALQIAEETFWFTAEPHIESLYNISATHALLGDREQAYEWLQKTLDAGFWDFRRLRTADEFASIREEEQFIKITRAAWVRQYIEMLEREEREEFQQPARVMETLAFESGERVADVGAGSGYFTVLVARSVGPDGVVLATDIRQEMLDHLENRLAEEAIDNVELKLVPKDDPQLPPGGLDTILMVDVWHYIRDPEFAKKLRAGLAPGGRLVIIDYRPRPWEERPWGPPPVQQTPREEVDEHMAQAGLVPVRVHDFLSEQYFVEYEAK